MVSLEQKVATWKEKMVSLEAAQEEQRQKYRNEIGELSRELSEAVAEEAKTREDNKEKLMVLFEGRVEQGGRQRQ